MNRRAFVRAGAGVSTAAGLGGLAGCLTRNGEDDDEPVPDEELPEEPDLGGEFRVVTDGSFVADEDAVGWWIKEAFEEEYSDAELIWVIPEAGLDHYVRRARQDAEMGADAYVGLTMPDLARVDDDLGGGGLFREVNLERVERAERIREDVAIGDPHGRVLPIDTSYTCLVYDLTALDPPETFDALTGPAYEGELLVPGVGSEPGLAFVLWTVDAFGEDAYLEFWRDLVANGVRILEERSDVVDAYLGGEGSAIVSYSTDQVVASRERWERDRHHVAFPHGQGYELPEGVAIFERTEKVDLAYAFLDFLLSSEVQAELARQLGQFPAVSDEHVALPAAWAEFAREPPEPVSIGYERLRGALDTWIDDWRAETNAY